VPQERKTSAPRGYYRGRLALVTGGTGFVGTHIVRQLLDAGARVRVPVHHRKPILEDRRIEFVPADLTRPDDCLRVMEGVDCCFHAAGAVSAAAVTVHSPMAPITANLILTCQVLEAAWTVGIGRILVFSSSTAYPVTDHPVREDELWSGPTHSSYFGYGWMRRYMERLAEFMADRSKVKVALVRPTAIYGPYDNFDPRTSHVLPALIRKAVERTAPFEVWGTGEEVRDFLHVEDMVRGCLLMLEHYAVCDPVNIGYGEGVTIRQTVGAILAAADYRDAEIVFDASKPTTIPRRVVDTSKARRLLGFEARYSLETGLAQTVKWFIEQRRLGALS
jgi:GDP-L-fucose synthase